MIILDAYLSPSLAPENFYIPCFSANFLDLQNTSDLEFFNFAKEKNAIFITKDNDFLELNNRFRGPPKIIWLTCGNSSKNRLKEIFLNHLSQTFDFLKTSEVVEISGK
jgi:predicted nuclease of predicted toxin-antitoxin system